LVLQIPDWWSNGFGVELPFDDVVNLFDFLDEIRVSSQHDNMRVDSQHECLRVRSQHDKTRHSGETTT
jgi:hypothetical protein